MNTVKKKYDKKNTGMKTRGVGMADMEGEE
jgi:hypothetical protein